jgi:hypothetical protein
MQLRLKILLCPRKLPGDKERRVAQAVVAADDVDRVVRALLVPAVEIKAAVGVPD